MARSRLERVVSPGRGLTPEEQTILNVDAIARVHNEPRLAFHAQVRPHWVQWVAEVSRALARAPLGREREVSVPLPPAITKPYQRTLRGVFETGRRHVVEELERQGALRRAFRDSSDPSLARVRKKARAAVDEVERAFVGGLAAQAQAHKLAGSSRAATATALATSATERVDRDILRLIDNGVPFTYNEGRIHQGGVKQAEIEEEVYTAMMDRKTCTNCERFDGLRGPRGTFKVPNPDCFGGDGCRCFTYYILKDERRAVVEGDPDPFRTMARQFPPGQASLSDVDPIFVDTLAREITRFAEGNKGFLGGVRITDNVTNPAVIMIPKGGGDPVLHLSRHFYGDAAKLQKSIEHRAGVKGWVPKGVTGEALALHDLRHEFAKMRWYRNGYGNDWTDELQSLHLRRGQQLSLHSGASPREFYEDLYSLRLANPGALDDELKAFLDVIEGRKKTLGLPKAPPKKTPGKVTKRTNPVVKKKAATDASPGQMPRGGNIANEGWVDFRLVSEAEREKWFTWRPVKTVDEFITEFERMTGKRIDLRFVEKVAGARKPKWKTPLAQRAIEEPMSRLSMARLDISALNEAGASMARFARSTRQDYWPRTWNFHGKSFMSTDQTAAYWWNADNSVNYRVAHFKKGKGGREGARPASGEVGSGSVWSRHPWDPEAVLYRKQSSSFLSPGYASERIHTMDHELGHARSISWAQKDSGSISTKLRDSPQAQRIQDAIRDDADAALKRSFGESTTINNTTRHNAVTALISEYATVNLDEVYAEFHTLYMWGVETGRLTEVRDWLPKLTHWYERFEERVRW